MWCCVVDSSEDELSVDLESKLQRQGENRHNDERTRANVRSIVDGWLHVTSGFVVVVVVVICIFLRNIVLKTINSLLLVAVVVVVVQMVVETVMPKRTASRKNRQRRSSFERRVISEVCRLRHQRQAKLQPLPLSLRRPLLAFFQSQEKQVFFYFCSNLVN